MDLKVLPDGPVVRISQYRGRGARGCRLDTDALERAVGLVGASLTRGCDVLIVNRFGKREAEGGGFRELIARALAWDVPVLTGVGALNRDDFTAYSGGLAKELLPMPDAVGHWLETSASARCSRSWPRSM